MSPEWVAFRNARHYSNRSRILFPGGSPEDWSRLDSVSDDYRLIGGSLFLLAGFLSLLPWAVSGSIAGVLLGSWFGGEIKKRLDRVNEEGRRPGSLGSGREPRLRIMCRR